MEKSKVYFTDMRVKAFGENLLGKLTKLITKAGIGTIDFHVFRKRSGDCRFSSLRETEQARPRPPKKGTDL